jgi:hypothetical protein
MLCFFWALHYYSQAKEVARWQAMLRRNDTPELLTHSPPDTSNALRTLARIHERTVFPPQYAQARNHLQQAIVVNPLQSVLWMDLARCQFFSGNRSAAEASLLRSDQLDPHYPLQRLEAIRLWHLLDHPERAKALAIRLGRMSGSVRIGVIRELIASGYSPAEVYDLLRLAALAPESLATLLRQLRVENPGMMRALFQKIPDSAYEEESFRREAVRIALDPLVPEVIYKAWRMDTPSPAQPLGVEESAENPLLAANLDLSTPAFSSDLPLGWQNVPELPWIEASWIAPTPESFLQREPGHIRLLFNDSPERPSSDFRWVFYRMIVPPGWILEVCARIQSLQPDQHDCRIVAVVNQRHSYRSSLAEERISDWRELKLSLPARTEWFLLELLLERKTPKVSQSSSCQVNLGGFSLHPRRLSASADASSPGATRLESEDNSL